MSTLVQASFAELTTYVAMETDGIIVFVLNPAVSTLNMVRFSDLIASEYIDLCAISVNSCKWSDSNTHLIFTKYLQQNVYNPYSTFELFMVRSDLHF